MEQRTAVAHFFIVHLMVCVAELLKLYDEEKAVCILLLIVWSIKNATIPITVDVMTQNGLVNLTPIIVRLMENSVSMFAVAKMFCFSPMVCLCPSIAIGLK